MIEIGSIMNFLSIIESARQSIVTDLGNTRWSPTRGLVSESISKQTYLRTADLLMDDVRRGLVEFANKHGEDDKAGVVEINDGLIVKWDPKSSSVKDILTVLTDRIGDIDAIVANELRKSGVVSNDGNTVTIDKDVVLVANGIGDVKYLQVEVRGGYDLGYVAKVNESRGTISRA